MPEICIKRLTLDVHLGWPDTEREKLQTVYLDMIIQFGTPPRACQTDDLQDTVCYQTLIHNLRSHLQKSSFRLIEHLVYVIYQFIKSALPADCLLKIAVTKYPDISGLLDGVRFSYGD